LADEILQQANTELDYVFVGVESGVTLTGIAQHLKKKSPNVKVEKKK
jgi:cystathionine beta-synthase